MIARAAVAAVLLAVQPAPPAVPAPPDGDRPSLCGMTAANVSALEAELARTLPAPSRDARYVTYEDRANLRLWDFTAAAHPAHPAVACITVETRNGIVGVALAIHCAASREACDSMRGEFEQLAEEVRRSMHRR
jgi:hypothetical protein